MPKHSAADEPQKEEAINTVSAEASESETTQNVDTESQPVAPKAAVPDAASGVQQKDPIGQSNADTTRLKVAIAILFLSAAVGLAGKCNDWPDKLAFNLVAFGLILAQGLVGYSRLKRQGMWAFITTAASLLTLGLSTFL